MIGALSSRLKNPAHCTNYGHRHRFAKLRIIELDGPGNGPECGVG